MIQAAHENINSDMQSITYLEFKKNLSDNKNKEPVYIY